MESATVHASTDAQSQRQEGESEDGRKEEKGLRSYDQESVLFRGSLVHFDQHHPAGRPVLHIPLTVDPLLQDHQLHEHFLHLQEHSGHHLAILPTRSRPG